MRTRLDGTKLITEVDLNQSSCLGDVLVSLFLNMSSVSRIIYGSFLTVLKKVRNIDTGG